MRKSDLPALLADVEFTETEVPSNTVTVTLHDHTGLGGPMGTETTSVIERWTFANAKLAMDFAALLIERMGRDDSRIEAVRHTATLFERFAKESRLGYESLVDLSSVGVGIKIDKPRKVIGNYTYEKPTVERVSAIAE